MTERTPAQRVVKRSSAACPHTTRTKQKKQLVGRLPEEAAAIPPAGMVVERQNG